LKYFVEIRTYIGDVEEGVELNYWIQVIPQKANRKFSFLSDGITPRKAIICTIHYAKKSFLIIEVERYGHSVSTLILMSVNITCDLM
jgi:hypothetical protein